MGCDLRLSLSHHPYLCFNPRTRMGCDSGSGATGTLTVVSIHAPAWGATHPVIGFFNPRFVSIHAPAWGATVVVRVGVELTQVSIHAPAWGATNGSATRLRRTNSFNPRTRMGCDKWQTQGNLASVVSIHAPAWGATARHLVRADGVTVSIHAPAWGATVYSAMS